MRFRKRKRVFYCVLVLLVWLGFVSEGSHALFVDAAALTGNTITTGTADLLISNSQNGSSTIYSDARAGFSLNLSPGGSEDHYFLVKNVSSDVPFDLDVQALIATGDQTFKQAIEIGLVAVDAEGITLGEERKATRYTMAQQRLAFGQILEPGHYQRYRLRTSLASTYGDQGQSIQYDLNLTGVQHYAQ